MKYVLVFLWVEFGVPYDLALSYGNLDYAACHDLGAKALAEVSPPPEYVKDFRYECRPVE